MEPKLNKLLQIGILVKDAEACVKNYEALGMGPWDIGVTSGKNIPDLYVCGEKYEEDYVKVAIMNAYGIEFELVEPLGDTPLKAWVEEHGNGLHHLAFVTEDKYDDILALYREKKGAEPFARGQAFNNLMDYSYLDLREELGMFVECYRNIKPGRPGIEFSGEAK